MSIVLVLYINVAYSLLFLNVYFLFKYFLILSMCVLFYTCSSRMLVLCNYSIFCRHVRVYPAITRVYNRQRTFHSIMERTRNAEKLYKCCMLNKECLCFQENYLFFYFFALPTDLGGFEFTIYKYMKRCASTQGDKERKREGTGAELVATKTAIVVDNNNSNIRNKRNNK